MRDPRTLWVSDDGVWAVADRLDIPLGVRVGLYHHPSILEAAILSWPGTWANDHNGGHAVCKVRRLDLPWEQEGDLVRITERIHTFGAKPAKIIPDWPLKCPRCARADSAVMLFTTYDCKHGCFK